MTRHLQTLSSVQRSLPERPGAEESRRERSGPGRSRTGPPRDVTRDTRRSRVAPHRSQGSQGSGGVMNGTRLLKAPGLTEPKEGICKIAVLGAAAVGKTGESRENNFGVQIGSDWHRAKMN